MTVEKHEWELDNPGGPDFYDHWTTFAYCKKCGMLVLSLEKISLADEQGCTEVQIPKIPENDNKKLVLLKNRLQVALTALKEISRPKRGGIDIYDSDEEWIEFWFKATERERTTARKALEAIDAIKY